VPGGGAVRLLYLVRHGRAARSQGRAVGHLDLPLAAAGARSIAALAASWQGPPPRRLFTSDLRRAADSARLLAARLGTAAETDRRLRELSFGKWEGLEWEEIHRRDRRRMESWGQRWWEVAPPGGEDFEELSRRVLAWFGELRGEDDVVMAVGHGGSLRALLAALLELPRSQVFELRLDHARASAVAVAEDRCRLLFLNQRRFRALAP
jgi:broad specificity phosphatase PhoE